MREEANAMKKWALTSIHTCDQKFDGSFGIRTFQHHCVWVQFGDGLMA